LELLNVAIKILRYIIYAQVRLNQATKNMLAHSLGGLGGP
jgi:hypothetical protein